MPRFLAVGAIIALCIGLVALLYFKPWRADVESPRFIDRLPLAEVIGKTHILELAEDLGPAIYSNQIAFREFLSPEFILSQGKLNGLNLQEPIYFFGDEAKGDISNWGAMIQVNDSSKILPGIRRFEKSTKISDSTLFDQRVYHIPEFDITIGYGKDWVLIARKASFKKYFAHVVSAKLNSIAPRWRRFLEDKLFNDKSLQMSVDSEQLREYGISSILCGSTADSSSFTLHARVSHMDTIPFTLKSGGEAFERTEFTKRMINLHLNIDRLRQSKDHPVYLLIEKMAKKISFPLAEFLNTWDGDISFRQGGIQTMQEPYIESELDENFNVTEVTKYKEVKISGFSLALSMNENRSRFMKRLFDKGILTSDNNKTRMLYFPPMKMQNTKQGVNFYTSSTQPKTVPSQEQSILWDYNYVPVLFTLDSIQVRTSFGKINIGLSKLVKDNIKEEWT